MTTPKDKPAREWKDKKARIKYCVDHLIEGANTFRKMAPAGYWHYETLEWGAELLTAYEKLQKENKRLKKEISDIYDAQNG